MTQAVALAQQASTGVSQGFKNRIINGAMVIDQRNAGASVTPSSGNYTLDRWNAGLTQASKFSVAQSTTAPTGFKNSLLVTSLSAYSITSTDIFVIRQPIEGLNTYDLAWGTASAKTVTLSFQVYSSLTGTFGGSLENDNADRSYPFTYTISSANTWTPVSITITGSTDGTWLTTNAVGILLNLGLGVGSNKSGTAGAWANADYRSATGATSVVGTNGATFYITGVQLEVGSTATSFDYRPFGTELSLCQRYFQTLGEGTKGSEYGLAASGLVINSAAAILTMPCSVVMRSTPTASVSGTATARHSGGSSNFTTLAEQYFDTRGGYVNVTISSGTLGSGCIVRSEGTNNGRIILSAEL